MHLIKIIQKLPLRVNSWVYWFNFIKNTKWPRFLLTKKLLGQSFASTIPTRSFFSHYASTVCVYYTKRFQYSSLFLTILNKHSFEVQLFFRETFIALLDILISYYFLFLSFIWIWIISVKLFKGKKAWYYEWFHNNPTISLK